MSFSGEKDVTQKTIVTVKILPTCLLELLFIINTASDIAVAIQLYRDGGNATWGACVTTTLVCLPVFVFVILEIVFISKNEKWSFKHAGYLLLMLIFCPVFAVLRYSEIILWLVEAVFVKTPEEKISALNKASKPRRIELYLFLRFFFQSLPQSFLQMFLLIYVASLDARMMQMLSLLTSILSAAVIATRYQRFESLEFKNVPWKKQETPSSTYYRDVHQTNSDVQVSNCQTFPKETELDSDSDERSKTLPRKFHYSNIKEHNQESVTNDDVGTSNNDEGTDTPPPPIPARYSQSKAPARPPSRHITTSAQVETTGLHTSLVSTGDQNSTTESFNQTMEQSSLNPDENDSDTILTSEVSETPTLPLRSPAGFKNTKTPPLPPKPVARSRSNRVSFLRHSYADSTSTNESFRQNRRSSYHYLPVSISDSNRSSEIKTISVPDFHAPPIPGTTVTPIPSTPLIVALPTRKKGTKYARPETTISHIVNYLKWFLFLSSRVIATSGLIAMRYDSLLVMLITLGCVIGHFVIMNIVISVNCEQTTRCWWKTYLLSLFSIICLLELGVKLEKMSRIFAVYWPMCFIENTVSAFLAYKPNEVTDIANWWNIYLFYTMITTYVLSTACLLFNTYVIGPRTYVLYDDESNNKTETDNENLTQTSNA